MMADPDQIIDAVRLVVVLFVFYIVADAFGTVLGYDLPFGI